MNTISAKRKKKVKRKQKTTSLPLHQAQPINKVYNVQKLILYIQINPFQKNSHNKMFNLLT